jgi:hypothetical protein
MSTSNPPPALWTRTIRLTSEDPPTQILEEVMPALVSRLRTALSELDLRSQEVIYRRYGLVNQPQTLEEVGTIYRVSKERIRQIESRALRLMRRDKQHWLASVNAHGADVWQLLCGGEDFVLARDVRLLSRELFPWLGLALDLCEMKLEEFLDRQAQRFGEGWIVPNWRLHELTTIRLALESRLHKVALPCALASVTSSETARVARAVLALIGFYLLGTYVAREPSTPSIQRALRLHSILGNAEMVLEIVTLANQYRVQFPADACRLRNYELVMQARKHLFLQVTETCWAALGLAGEAPHSLRATEFEITSVKNGAPKYEWQTISKNLEIELRSSGPSRISDLIKRAPNFLPSGRSENSIGWVLNTDKDVFVRPLPGIYALHDQVPSPEQVLVAPPQYMFNEYQVRLYALARRAGEPWGTYPLWLPESEYQWCIWADKNAGIELLESLLSVADVNAWPEIADLENWREITRSRGRFSLNFPPSPGALILPRLDRLLAACLYVRQHGCLGWISSNHLLLQSAHSHGSAGLLALLIALRIVTPDAEDWQGPHSPGPRLDEQLARLERVLVQSGSLDWNTGLGRALKAEAITAPGAGWVSPALLQELFGSTTNEP